jgi:hypothetical protein
MVDVKSPPRLRKFDLCEVGPAASTKVIPAAATI